MTLQTIAGIVFVLVSAYLLRQSILALRQGQSSLTWPAVTGEILSFDVSKPKATSNHRVMYVQYAYTVDGVTYEGRRDAFYTLLGDEVLALQAQFEASKAVEVFYDPKSPETSTLITGVRPEKKYSDIILACLGVAVGAGLVVFG